MEAPEEIIVDGNQLGEGQSFLNFYISVSPNQNLVAIVKDTVGRNFYTISVKDMTTGALLPDEIKVTRGGIAWMNDNQSFYYVIPDKKNPPRIPSLSPYAGLCGCRSIDLRRKR
jgi:oligopeptidase B